MTTEQGWQVSAKSGLNRGLNTFKTAWQKQVSATQTGFLPKIAGTV